MLKSNTINKIVDILKIARIFIYPGLPILPVFDILFYVTLAVCITSHIISYDTLIKTLLPLA